MADCLLVLLHGLWGQPEHMWCVKEAVEKAHPEVHILVCDSSMGNRTYDGVDVIGERVAADVRKTIADLKTRDDITITKISFVGYSLGGVAARFAIGVLQHDGFFDTVQPVSFTTFATPHLGVSPTSRGILPWLVTNIGPRSLSLTGAHIFLADSVLSSSRLGQQRQRRPLMEIMTEPESVFVKGLTRFTSLNCYANIANDRSVPYFSAAIASTDPFRDLKTVRLNHLEKYGDVVLDPAHPYDDLKDGETAEEYTYALWARERVLRTVLLAGLPLWLLVFAVNAVIANYKSSRRIKAHRSENSDKAETMYAIRAQELVEETLQTTSAGTADTTTGSSDTASSGFKLNDVQARMVSNLNKLPWYKVPVHVRKTQHSHAAIVCRTPDTPRLDEGRQVMQHWLDHVKLF